MAYNLDQFIADCRASLARDPGVAGREEVRLNLEKLLANPDFISKYAGDDQPRGLKVLYEDPKLGFQVLAHINDKAAGVAAARPRLFVGDLRPGHQIHRHDRVGARG